MGARGLQEDTPDTVEWAVLGKTLKLKSSDPERLKKAMEWVESRLAELQAQKPYSGPLDHSLLLLLEMSLEREEMRDRGKDLLKRADRLIDYVSEMTRSS